jgi:hypothetical protein
MKSNAEIGADLYMSVATVKAYASRLLTRLELNNRVQAPCWCTTPPERETRMSPRVSGAQLRDWLDQAQQLLA